MSRSSNRMLAVAWAVGAGLLAIDGSLADCPPQPLDVVLNTGWDESAGTVIPAGGTDDDWDVTFDASGPVSYDANVYNPHPAWLTMPNSQWIAANMFGPNGTYRYKTCWCMDGDYSSPNMAFAIRADDQADVFVNGTLVLSLPEGTFNDASPLGMSVFPGLLHAGVNCMEVVVQNLYGGPTGFNLTGWVTADDGLCCDCDEADILDDAATGVDDLSGDLIATGSDDDEWVVTTAVSGGVLPRPADAVGMFFGWDLIPGTKWISADVFGPGGVYTYEKCWCMNPAFQNPLLSMQILADDQADVFLNGALIGSTPSPGVAFPATSISAADPGLFRAGENCVTVEVSNTSGNVTGLDVAMTITATNAECCPCTDLPPDAEGWWPLDETAGPIAAELLNDHDGTWVGSPFPLLGMVAGSLDLDGTEDHVAVPSDPGLDFGTGQDFSFDAWIKTGSMVRQVILQKKKPLLPTEPGYAFSTGGGFLTLEIADGTAVQNCIGDIPVANDAWHFVAATVDRDPTGDFPGIRLYVDGVLDQVCDPITVSGSLVNAEQLYFGADPLSTPTSRKWWNGQLDEIEIFRRALTDLQVEAIFIAGNSGKCPPQPCEDSTGIPMCAGTCETGFTCVAGSPPAGPCQCVPVTETCEGTLQGPCGGPCPDRDDVCVGTGPGCRCERPPQCGSDATCDEACPQGLVCRSTVNGCTCVQEVVPCGNPQYPTCDGACPANQGCKQTASLGCECVTCGTDPLVVKLAPRDEIRWTPVACALVYNLYRGVGTKLIDQNADGLADDYGSCHIGDIIDTKVSDPGNPPQHMIWYLITSEGLAGEGPLGNNSHGQPRQATNACP